VPAVRMSRLNKAYKYCNSYVMCDMHGGCNGLNTIIHKLDKGRFDLPSSCQQDGVAILGPGEVPEQIKQLGEEGTIPKWFKKNKLKDSNGR
jgi:hypothetical protein